MWLFVGTVPMNKELFVGTVPMNKELFVGTVPMNKELFVGTLTTILGHEKSLIHAQGLPNEEFDKRQFCFLPLK